MEREIKEPDVWFHPVTKEFKVWRNGKWNPAREEDIPPALMTALKAQAGIFRIGGTDTEAGIFFQYDKDTKNPVFGSTDSENLAQVSIDKEANVLIRNANNKLAFNMRNPENPSEIISQLLMGVYNADDLERHKNTLFQVGDESTGTYLRFLRNGNFTQQIDNKEIKQYFKEFENQIDGKINTFSQTTDPSVNWTEDEKLKSVGDLWYNPTTKVTKRWNGTTWEEQDVKDKVAQEIAKSKNTVFVSTPVPPYKIGDLWIKNQEIYDCISVKESGAFAEGDWKKSTKYTDDTTANNAINNQNNGHLTVNANTTFVGDASFISRGSNETTVINAGSISFTRAGQTITTIRNMRSGSISTDGNGSGYVDFTGMKSGLLIIPSIQSFNVSSNVRSLNCRSERDPNYTAQNRYRFYVYGTQENQEAMLFETTSANTWGKTAYTVGVEGSTVSTWGSAKKAANSKSEAIRNLSYRVLEFPVIHQDVYIQGAYYGRVSYSMPSPSVYVDGGSVVVAVSSSSIWNGYSGMSKTTQSKDWKSVEVITSLSGSYRVAANGEYKYTVWDHESGAQVYWSNFGISVDLVPGIGFANMKCYYIPTNIQSIVGGGTVSYLAIEQ